MVVSFQEFSLDDYGESTSKAILIMKTLGVFLVMIASE